MKIVRSVGLGAYTVLASNVLFMAGCAAAERGAEDGTALDSLSMFAADSGLVSVRGMALDGRGNLWVLNSREPFLARYDTDGNISLRALVRGQGPNEATMPVSIIPDHAPAAVAVWDARTRELIRIAYDGTVHARHRLESVSGSIRADIAHVSHGEPYKFQRTGDGFVVAAYPPGLMRAGDFKRGLLLRVDSSFATQDTLLKFAVFGDPDQPPDQRDLTAVPLWSGCDATTVAVFDA